MRQAADLVPSAPEAMPPGFEDPAREAAPLTFDPPAQTPSPVPWSAPPEAAPPGFEPPAAQPPLAPDSPWRGDGPQPGFGPGQPPSVDLPPAEARPSPVPPVPPGPPPGNPPRSTSKIIALVAGVVILAAGGGLAAWKLLGHHSVRSAGQSPQASTPSPAPSPSQTPPSSPGAVTIAPGVSQQPDAAKVASFLQAYFTAINNHNYGQYISLLQPQLRPTVGQFNSGYGGTSDSNATLTALSTTANGVAATVTFTSHQPADNSVTHTACTDWNVTLYLQSRDSDYRNVSPPAGYHAQYVPCS